jgi:diacylglycerol kinase family enzyme
VPGIGVVVNPHAGANRIAGPERVEVFSDVVGNDGLVRVTESVEAIEEVAREFRDHGTEILAVCGGDGSYHCTLSGFRAVYGDRPLPMLLPLRAARRSRRRGS